MRLPQGLSGAEIIAALGQLDYKRTRQTGSHVRLTTERNGEHHVTVPLHRSLPPGTLNAILREVAFHHGITKNDLLSLLFDDRR